MDKLKEEGRVTAARLMAIYGISRRTAVTWFQNGLIIAATRGPGITDSWSTTPAALIHFHNTRITAANVYRSGEPLNLPGPWREGVAWLAKEMKVTRAMALRYVKAGYVPGAIKLPGERADWRLPVNCLDLVKELKSQGPGDLEVVIGRPLPDPRFNVDKLLAASG